MECVGFSNVGGTEERGDGYISYARLYVRYCDLLERGVGVGSICPPCAPLAYGWVFDSVGGVSVGGNGKFVACGVSSGDTGQIATGGIECVGNSGTAGVSGGGNTDGAAVGPPEGVGGQETEVVVESCEGLGLKMGASEVVRGPCGGVSVQPRGPNYKRNVERRMKKKEEKKKKEQKFPEHIGTFSVCTPEVQRQLRTTYASRLIAENEAAEMRAKRQVGRNDSDEELLRRIIVRMELEKKTKKLAGASHIGGWAKTVAEVCASSVSSPALSRVPSLESVGLGSSVSSDDSTRRSTRLALYEENKRLLELELESREYLQPGEVEVSYKALANEFHDVLFTPEENERRKLADHLEGEYAAYGMNSLGAKKLIDELVKDISFEGKAI